MWKHIRGYAGSAVLAAAGCAASAAAQQGTHPAAAGGEAPSAVAVRAAGAVRVDGRLDDEAWGRAEPITRFTQLDPEEGRPASERTEVRVLFDDDALYVGARMHDAGGAVSSRLARRDVYMSDSDWLTIALDSYHDHTTAYEFRVNPSGVTGDAALSGGGTDRSWDPVWQAATAVDDSGWVAEIRIPFSQLRFSRDEAQTWGVQVVREIARRQERALFAFTPKNERAGVARYGHLSGLAGLRPGRSVELMPYVAARGEYLNVPVRREGVAFRNPFRDGSDLFADAGLDLRYRPTSNLTLSATVNPDFGQVEVDPAVVNLSAYETFYAEKRPFFVEGSGIFGFGGSAQLFYSRRIGRGPQGSVPSGAVFSDVPQAATILAAGKLTGRTRNGWTVGVMDALTGRERVRYLDAAGDEHRATVEPLSNYLVGRVRRELRGGQTSFGAMATAVNRDLDDDVLATFLRRAAYAGGVDFRHEWDRRSWSVSGSLSASHVLGSPAAIRLAQRSSARYFHRPDASHVELDTTAASLTGYAASASVIKEAGEHWVGGVFVNATSPGFEVNDLGFQTSADRVAVQGYAVYTENRPGRRFRTWNVNPGLALQWNYGGNPTSATPYLQVTGTLLSYWTGSVYLSRGLPVLDDRLTRGGPLARTTPSLSVSAFVNSDARRKVTASLSAFRYRTDAGDRTYSLGASVGLKPASNWSLTLGPRVSGGRTFAQYVTSLADTAAHQTFGRRYVFAGLRQRTVALDTRLNVTFTPALTLEMYAQPFISGADYGALRQLRAPRTFAFDSVSAEHTAEIGERDFNLRSLRGSAVLRWEWRPGSTAYLAWQQSRSDYAGGTGDFRLGRDLPELLEAQPDNVFVFKVTYWLAP